MATKLRLQRHGKKGKPFYKIVAADSRARRDGKFIDGIGTYNPTTIPATILLDVDKAVKWLQNGAEPTNTVKAILQYKGAFYKKHLLRGVQMGIVKAEDVEEKFTAWVSKKDNSILTVKSKAQEAKWDKINASVKSTRPVKEVEVVAEEPTAEVVVEEPTAEVTETPAETAE